jgi:ABC-type Fe3+/spermidine/putrescine transport system ATPase subunit
MAKWIHMSGIFLDGLGKRYGSVDAVSEVTISIDPGAFVTLLGPSGSGKTTTLRMIAGLERPSAGTVKIGDRVMSGPGIFVPTHKRRLGMVFQSYAVWPHKTVFENVVFPLAQSGVDHAERKRRVDHMLGMVDLGDYGGRYPSQLSGGQQQRVSLARALVAKPEVILFDEPLSNLDAKLRESMRDLLRELHDDVGTTAVYVTHDQVEAMVLSSHIHVMNKGRVVESGTPQDLYDRPQTRFAAQFIGYANILPIDAVDRSSRTVRLGNGASVKVESIPETIKENVVIVRPHRVGLAAGEETLNILEGTVRSVSFLGDRSHLSVEVPGCGTVMVDMIADGTSLARKGDPVRLQLPPNASVLL